MLVWWARYLECIWKTSLLYVHLSRQITEKQTAVWVHRKTSTRISGVGEIPRARSLQHVHCYSGSIRWLPCWGDDEIAPVRWVHPPDRSLKMRCYLLRKSFLCVELWLKCRASARLAHYKSIAVNVSVYDVVWLDVIGWVHDIPTRRMIFWQHLSIYFIHGNPDLTLSLYSP